MNPGSGPRDSLSSVFSDVLRLAPCFSRFPRFFFRSALSFFFCSPIPEVSGGISKSLGFQPVSTSLETPDLIS
jgi:hypothetical protein